MLVVTLLHRCGDDTRNADAVATHDERLLLAALVEEARAERDRVTGSELEDVADLDRRLEAERTAADRAAVAFLRLADVGEAGLEVAAVLDAAEVPPAAVRAGDELAVAERLVGDHLALEPDRPERAGVGAERGADLLDGRRAHGLVDRGEELRLLEPVVAAHEREDHRAVVLRHRHRLRRR